MPSDEQSFEVVYEQYRGRIRGYLLKSLMDPPLADDLTQETFIRAWQRWHLFDGRNLVSWLHQIAKNLIIDYVRVQQSRPQVSLDVAIDPLRDEVKKFSWLSRLTASRVTEPEVVILEYEEYERLYAALRQLSSSHRTAVIALSGYSIPVAVLARHLGTTQIGVKALAFRARDNLRVLLLGQKRKPRYTHIWTARQLTCQHCGQPFEVHYRPRAKITLRRYCSRTCRQRGGKLLEQERRRLAQDGGA